MPIRHTIDRVKHGADRNPLPILPDLVHVHCTIESRKAQLDIYLDYYELETAGRKDDYHAGVLYVQVDQQHVSPLGWPILLQPSACSRLAFLGSSRQVTLQATAGNAISVMVETQDCLQQRICLVSCNPPTAYIHACCQARTFLCMMLTARAMTRF